ncbi:MAG: FeoA family protein [Candidatus Aminicenantes bacterium]|jgi:DtxR family Mn-dependent transcriptional regulator
MSQVDADIEIKKEEPLVNLKTGEKGRVMYLSSMCRGPERQRLIALGVLPGTVIQVEMASPFGDPVAYRIRDAVIGLRKEQAQLIRVIPL